MRLILVGPPGAGKGTQAVFLASHFAVPHISTGDIFRLNLKNGTPLGIQAKSFMDNGNLVPDSITNEMVKDRFTHGDVGNGFLLDGYPRNVDQAEFLDSALTAVDTPLDAVLELKIENEEIIKRLSSRRTCRGCGNIYSDTTKKCENCDGELYQREDDKAEVIKHRLNVYAEQTAPIIDFYQKTGLLKSISALGEVADISKRAIDALTNGN
ncbi:adenylate kinase [Actinomycetes bacterium]|nr:adenylate kinase [Actinomycetes bacterium]